MQNNLVRMYGDRPSPFDPAATYKGNGALQPTSGARIVGLGLYDLRHTIRPIEGAVTYDDIQIRKVVAGNVYRLLETNQAGQRLTNFVMEDVTVNGFERSVARLWNLTGGIFRRIKATGLLGGDPFPMGLHFEGNCHDIVVEDVDIGQTYDSRGSGYQNGEPIADEGSCSEMVYRNCKGHDADDAAFDVKSNPRFEGVNEGWNVHRVYRIWNGAIAEILVAMNFSGQAFWTDGQRAAPDPLPLISIDKAIVRGAAPGANSVFRNENGPADWQIGEYDIEGVSGLILHMQTFGRPITWLRGGWYTPVGGMRTWYPGAPPTGTGGVLI